MARSRETKIELTAYDDLFQTDESREEAKLSKIRDIPKLRKIIELRDWQPPAVCDNICVGTFINV